MTDDDAVAAETVGILENCVLLFDMGATDLITAPEVTIGGAGAELEGVNTGGGALNVGTFGALILCLWSGFCIICCWNCGDSNGGPGLTMGWVLAIVTSVLHLLVLALLDEEAIEVNGII